MPAIDNLAETRAAIIENYNAYAEGLDSKDWRLVRNCFADEVYLDYGDLSSPSGGPDEARRADDWIPVLQGVINGFDITRHTITNHRFEFEGELVTCRAYLTAEHVIYPDPTLNIAGDQDVVTVVGEYTNAFRREQRGWVIRKSKLVMNYFRGNVALLGTAMARAAAGQAG